MTTLIPEMRRVARAARRRARSGLTKAKRVVRTQVVTRALAHPEQIRGERITRAASRQLEKHWRAAGVDPTLRDQLLTATNPQAVIIVAEALSGLKDPTELQAALPQLVAQARRLKSEGVAAVVVPATLVLGREKEACELAKELLPNGIPPAALSASLVHLIEADKVDAWERLVACQPDAAIEQLSARASAAYLVAQERAQGRSMGDLIRTHGSVKHVADLVVKHAIGSKTRVPLAELTDAAHALLALPHPPRNAVTKLMRTLHERGDYDSAHDLAWVALRMRPDDARAQSIMHRTRDTRKLLTTGWTPESAHPRDIDPRNGTVMYLLHNSLPWASGGYATRTHGLLTGLAEQGWEMHGVTRPTFPYDTKNGPEGPIPNTDEIDGVSYHRLLDGQKKFPFWPVDQLVSDYTRLLDPFIREHRPGIIHGASNYRNGLAAVAAARRHGLASVYEVRGLWELTRQVRDKEYPETRQYKVTVRLEADAAAHADKVLVITKALGRIMMERGIPEEKIVLVPNGVDVDRFVPMERDEELARQLGVSGKTVIGYIGTTVDYEGLGLLVEAVANLRQERDDFAVIIVGDGPEWSLWRAQAEAAGLLDIMHFTGRVPHEEVERYYSLVDIAPLPRLPEKVTEAVSPLKPFEVMAVGKTLVVSDVDALKEIVQDGVTGLTFTKGSSAALTEKLRLALDSPELRARINQQGREWVVKERSWRIVSGRVDEVYRELWDRYHPGFAYPEPREWAHQYAKED